MSEAIIAKKAEQVAIVADKMKAAASIVVVDSRGLTVDQDTVLRRNLRESGVEFKVIKNSILSRAAEKAGLEDLKTFRWSICSSILERRCYRTSKSY